MEIPYTISARRDTGLFNAKIGIWLFLASEVMLFGGLFSGYVFLRAGVQPGVDIPWPNGIDVHGDGVFLGFANTLVLILSSVFVVMAWCELKLRRWGRYTAYMWGVLICAGVFMVNKGIEYNTKFHHFGVRLVDGTLLDGSLVKDAAHGYNGDIMRFEANAIEFAMDDRGVERKIPTYFLKFAKSTGVGAPIQIVLHEPVANIEKDKPVTYSEGKETNPMTIEEATNWLNAKHNQMREEIKKQAYDLRKTMEGNKPSTAEERQKWRREYWAINPLAALPAIKGKFVHPVNFEFTRHDVMGGKPHGNSVSFFGGSRIEGKAIDTDVDMEVHSVDLQMVNDDENALAWKFLGNEYKAGYRAWQKEFIENFDHEYPHWREQGGTIPSDEIRLWPAKKFKPAGEHGAAHGEKTEHGGEAAESGHGEHGGGHGHHSKVVTIPRDQIRFMSSHGPAFGTYYAIYFTMTALHGLHVVGGALVLAYFLFFGKKMYKNNPEHLANRVEVGGLFWHFVDLVWIFLFPIFYLM